jgi:tetratricopeptide (TPR) repeat protein
MDSSKRHERPRVSEPAPAGVPQTPGVPSRPFVGRDREMALASAAVESILGGRGRILLFAGEPGIGKSRTADEIAAVARSRGAEVLIGRCYEGEGAPPFWPWVQILRGFARSRDAAGLMRSLGPGASDVAQMSPDLRERLPGLAIPPAMDGDQARFRQFDSVARLFARAAEEKPLVVILDDLQGADEPSLQLLRFLARETRDSSLLVVGTYRDYALNLKAELTEALGELAREESTERITLKGLNASDVNRYIELLTGIPPSSEVVESVHAGTAGNPLFMTDVVRSLVENGQVGASADAWSGAIEIPDGVRSAVARRLSLLSVECVDILGVAAGFGREFAESALARTCGIDRERSRAALEEALAARLIEPDPEGQGRYRFVHVMVRDALYEQTPPTRRSDLHLRIGEALEAAAREGAEPPYAELATHFFAAADPRAVIYARRAGDRALDLLAFEEAARQYDFALRALDRTEPSAKSTRFDLLLARAEAENRAGKVDHAKVTVQRALEIARKRHDPEQLSRAALAYGVRGIWGEPGAVDHVLVGLLEEALRSWGEEEGTLQAKLLARLASALLFADARERREDAAARSLAMARRLGDPGTLAIALIAHRAVAWRPDEPEQRLAMASELVKLIDESRDPERAFGAHLWRFTDLLELGDTRAVDFELGECRRIADRLRDPFHHAHVAVLAATRAALEGRFEDAEAIAEDLVRRGGAGPGTGNVFWLVVWMPKRWKGRLGDLAGPLGVIAEQFPGVPALEAALAMALTQEDRVEDVRIHYDRLAETSFGEIPRDQNFLVTASCLAECAAYLNDAAGSRDLYEALLPYARSHVVDPNGVAYFGAIAHSLGLLARTMSRLDEACSHFRDALAAYTRMGARPWVALGQLEFARALVARGAARDREEAQWHLEQSLATALTLGMTSLQRSLERFTQTSTARPERDAAATGPAPDPVRTGSSVPSVPRELEESVRREESAGPGIAVRGIAYSGAMVVLRDTRGVELLAHLIEHPWIEIPASTLMRQGAEPRGAVVEERSLAEDGLSIRTTLGDAGEPIDETALRDYEKRLDVLRAELEQARNNHDVGWAGHVQAEIESLQNQLAGAFGLRARGRRIGSDAERARVAVTKRLREVIRRVEPLHEGLARHLRAAIRTGTRCSYRPPPGPRAVVVTPPPAG